MSYQPFLQLLTEIDLQILYNIQFNDLRSLIVVNKYVSGLIMIIGLIELNI